MKRAVYHRRQRVTMRPALQVTLAVLAVALLPGPVEWIARSDLIGPLLGWSALAVIVAVGVYLWPVKR